MDHTATSTPAAETVDRVRLSPIPGAFDLAEDSVAHHEVRIDTLRHNIELLAARLAPVLTDGGPAEDTRAIGPAEGTAPEQHDPRSTIAQRIDGLGLYVARTTRRVDDLNDLVLRIIENVEA